MRKVRKKNDTVQGKRTQVQGTGKEEEAYQKKVWREKQDIYYEEEGDVEKKKKGGCVEEEEENAEKEDGCMGTRKQVQGEGSTVGTEEEVLNPN